MVRYHGTQPGGGKAGRGYGFARASEAVGAYVAGAGAGRGFAEQRLLTQWPDIIGRDLAALCRPVRVSHRGRSDDRGGTLVVLVEGALAAELAHREAEIVERVNRVYGYRAISRIRITQTHGTLARDDLDRGADAANLPAAPPSAGVLAIEDESLRGALARLEANIRRRADRAGRRPTTEGTDR